MRNQTKMLINQSLLKKTKTTQVFVRKKFVSNQDVILKEIEIKQRKRKRKRNF